MSHPFSPRPSEPRFATPEQAVILYNVADRLVRNEGAFGMYFHSDRIVPSRDLAFSLKPPAEATPGKTNIPAYGLDLVVGGAQDTEITETHGSPLLTIEVRRWQWFNLQDPCPDGLSKNVHAVHALYSFIRPPAESEASDHTMPELYKYTVIDNTKMSILQRLGVVQIDPLPETIGYREMTGLIDTIGGLVTSGAFDWLTDLSQMPTN